MGDEERQHLKSAITDLYLAIKIRSTEEVSLETINSQLEKMDDNKLFSEREKLENADCY